MFIAPAADVLHSVRSAILSIPVAAKMIVTSRCIALLKERELSVGGASIKTAPLGGDGYLIEVCMRLWALVSDDLLCGSSSDESAVFDVLTKDDAYTIHIR
jgi:hypothetical protein